MTGLPVSPSIVRVPPQLVRGMLAFGILASGCSLAQIHHGEDGATEDTGTVHDGGADDATVPSDAGWRRAVPAGPTAPSATPSILTPGGWLASTSAADLALADPRTSTPTPPSFAGCAPWAGGGASPCEPWPAGHQTCTGTMEHFPGESGCSEVGSACPSAGSWAADLPGGATVLYVRTGGGGAGTMASPYATLAPALADAAGRGVPVVVALAAGTYVASVVLPPNVSLWGACPASTVLTPAAIDDEVILAAAGSEVHNLRIMGGGRGVSVPPGADVTIERVIVEGASVGVSVNGGMADVHDVALRGMRAVMYARGVEVTAGRIDLHRAVVRDVPGASPCGIVVTGAGTVASIDDVAFRNVALGAYVGTSATLTADHTAIEASAAGGVWVQTASLTLAHSMLRQLGGGAVGGLGNSLEVSATAIENVVSYGVSSNGPATLHDLVIRDVARDPTGGDGSGIASWVSTVTADRVLIERPDGDGLNIWDGASFTASSLDIVDAGVDARATLIGVGAHVTDSAHLALTASRITGARAAGVLSGGCIGGHCFSPGDPVRWSSAIATLTDVEIADTRPSADGLVAGYGVLVTESSSASLRRAVISGSAGAQIAAGHAALGLDAVWITLPGTVTVDDVMLRGGTTGRGILAADGSSITGGRVAIAPTHELAVASDGHGSIVELGDLVIADCTMAPGGSLAATGGSLTIARASIVRIVGAGARAMSGGALSITDGRITQCTDGATAESGAMLVLRRVALASPRGNAIVGDGALTNLTLTDVSVSDSMAASGGGLVLRGGATATATALGIDAPRAALIFLADRTTTLSAMDLTLSCGVDASGSRCAPVTVSSGASSDLERVSIAGARGIAAAAFGSGSMLTLRDALVAGTTEASCGSDRCAIGVGLYDTSSSIAERVEIRDTAGTAVQLGSIDATLAMNRGAITRALTAAEIPATIDPATVLVGVSITDCTTEISSHLGPLPMAPLLP